MNTTITKIATIGVRPTQTPDGKEIPTGWPIYNAPRPLYGNPVWVDAQAPFRSFGWFFACVDPSAADPFNAKCNAEYIEENRRLDARELVFVNDAEAFAKGVEAFAKGVEEVRARYGNRYGVEEKVNDPKYRDYFVTRGIEALSIEEDPHA